MDGDTVISLLIDECCKRITVDPAVGSSVYDRRYSAIKPHLNKLAADVMAEMARRARKQ